MRKTSPAMIDQGHINENKQGKVESLDKIQFGVLPSTEKIKRSYLTGEMSMIHVCKSHISDAALFSPQRSRKTVQSFARDI